MQKNNKRLTIKVMLFDFLKGLFKKRQYVKARFSSTTSLKNNFYLL